MQNRRRSRQILEVINSTSPLKALENNNTFEVGVRNIDLVMNRKATIASRTKCTMVGFDVYHDLSKGDVERPIRVAKAHIFVFGLRFEFHF